MEVSRPAMMRRVDQIGLKFRRRQILGSKQVALTVAMLMREIVAQSKFSSFAELTAHLEDVGQRLQACGRREVVIQATFRRILKMLKEEYDTALSNFHHSSTGNAGSGAAAGDDDDGDDQDVVMHDHRVRDSAPDEPQTPAAMAESTFAHDPFAEPSHLSSFFELLGHKPPQQRTATGGLTTNGHSGPSTGPPSPSSSVILQRPTLLLRTPTAPAIAALKDQEIRRAREESFDKDAWKLKPVLLEAIQEFIEEVEGTEKAIGDTSFEFLHSGELIMTIGYSRTVLAFLKNAHRKRKFTVLVAESAPSMRGRQFAADLSAASIPTILIPDANVLALLPRCSKAILSPHLVLADGSLVSSTGSYPLALAARKMRVPLVVVAGMYKFCPSYGGGHEEGDPSAVLDDSTLSNDQQPHDNHRHHSSSSHGATGDQDGSDAGHTNVRNPLWDRVPSKLVDLYITNLGGHPASLIGRLMGDMYGPS